MTGGTGIKEDSFDKLGIFGDIQAITCVCKCACAGTSVARVLEVEA